MDLAGCEGKGGDVMRRPDLMHLMDVPIRRASSTSSIRVTSTLNRPNNDEVMLATALVVSAIMKDSSSGRAVKEHYSSKLARFDQSMYVDRDDGKDGENEIPDAKEIFQYFAKIVEIASFNPESLVMSLVYVNRLIKYTGLHLGPGNWRLITLMSILLAQKVWDDMPLTNVDFPVIWREAVPGAPAEKLDIKAINMLERTYLELLQYSMHVTASLYAKYYFELRTLAGSDTEFPQPLSKDEAAKLEQKSAYQEQACQDEKFKRAYTMIPGSRHEGKSSGKGRAILS